jgi:hypothetical protein
VRRAASQPARTLRCTDSVVRAQSTRTTRLPCRRARSWWRSWSRRAPRASRARRPPRWALPPTARPRVGH